MGLIRALIDLYILLIIVDVILSYLPQFSKTVWAQKIRTLANYTCGPIRKHLPSDLPVDASPLIVIVGLKALTALW